MKLMTEKRHRRMDKLVDLLAEPMTKKEIRKATGLSPTPVQDYLAELIQQGRVSAIGERLGEYGNSYEVIYKAGKHEFVAEVRRPPRRSPSKAERKIKVPQDMTDPVEAQKYIVARRHELDMKDFKPHPDASQFWLIGLVGKQEGVSA